jgi:ribA/ribD-fused uncharacterized protein
MYPDSSEGLNKETDDTVYFFTVPFEPLNNWSPHRVSIWNNNFSTSEHAFQWKKFSEVEPSIATDILNAESPYVVFKITQANKDKQPKNWIDIKVGIMEEILRAKFAQHEDVRDALKRTGNRRIAENSPVDSFWGLGPNKDGLSMLGNIWMKIRDGLA